MNKKSLVICVGCVLIAIPLVILVARFSSSEDSWICDQGQWVRHGNPSSEKPKTSCGEEKKEAIDEKKSEDNLSENRGNKDGKENDLPAYFIGDGISVSKPMANEIISTPVEIIGEAKGNWFFEGSFPIKLTDKDGKIIAEAPAQALGEWMTSDSVPFRAILEFSAPKGSSGALIMMKDNPSDQAQAEEVKMPVIFGNDPKMKIRLFFSSLYFDPESQDCGKVYEVGRVIPKTKAVVESAIKELLAGPTDEERMGGFFSNINPGVSVKKISVVGGKAKVDFDEKMGEGMGGSCRTDAVRAQITETLKQFPTVKNVEISIDGKTEGILQP